MLTVFDRKKIKLRKGNEMTKKILSLGKRRGLSQCANEKGVFNILALDHRQAVKKVFVDRPDPYAEAVAFKRAVVKTLAPFSTAILLDPSIGAGPCLADNSLPGKCGLVITVEASGYEGPSHARVSRLPVDWSTDTIKRLGASAVKLLVYYHSHSTTAPAMQKLVSQVSTDCQRLDIPLFLEILTYSPDAGGAKLTPQQFTEGVVSAAADLTPIGGDILKVEFPVDVKVQPDKKIWEEACLKMSAVSKIPWVLLSAGVDYSVFAEQTEVACKAGASGILAGRAIWKESLEVPIKERDGFLQTIGCERLRFLENLCSQYGRPYTDFLEVETLAEDWYGSYHGF
jgi:tagatose 1,6-diphosphate aldolase